MIRARHNTLLLILLSIAVLATIVIRYAEPIDDGDIWFHLAYGRYLLGNNTLIPDHSIFSWTHTDNSQIYCAWIPEIIFYLLYKAGGMYPLYALRYLFIIVFIMLVTSISIKNPIIFLPATLFICLSGLLMSHSGLSIKAELFSFIFMTMMVWTWFRIKAHPNKTWPLFYLFPLLMLLWVNSHGGFIFGIVFLGLVLVGEVINWLTGSSEKLDPQNRKHLFISIILSGLTLLITPYGWRYPVQLLNKLVLNPKEFSRQVNTMLAYFSIYDPHSFHLDLIVYLITSLAILIILLFTQIRKSKIDWTLLFVNVPFIIIYIKYGRATYFWAIIFVFSSLYLIGNMSQDNLRLLENKPLKLVIHTITLILLLFIVVPVQYAIFIHGYNIIYNPPVIEAEYIRSKFPHLRVGNDYNSGTYLLWSLWPTQKVFIDARYFPYHTWYDEYNEFVLGSDKTLKDLFIKKYDCDLWCLPLIFPNLDYFMRSPEWRLVYYGPSACIFLSKHIPYHNGHEISASVYNVSFNQKLNTSNFALSIGDFDTSRRLLTQMNPSLLPAQQKNLVLSRLLTLGDTMYAYNKSADAIDVFSYIISIEPNSALVYIKKGLAEAQLSKFTQAIESYKEAIRLDPISDMAYYNLAFVLMALHRFDEAIICYSKVLEIDPQNPYTRRNLAIAVENKKILTP